MALSKKQLDASFSNEYVCAEALPAYVRDCTHPVERDFEMPDFAEVMRRGWRWALEGMQSAQPLTWKELESFAPALEYREVFTEDNGEKLYWGDLLLRLQDRYLPVFPYSREMSYEFRVSLGEVHPFVSSLPASIGFSHYNRVAGLGWVTKIPYGYGDYSRMWPHRADMGMSLRGLFASERRKNGNTVADELRRFLTTQQTSVDDVLGAFYVFLDTRPAGDISDSGALYLVEANSEDRRILSVQSMDFTSLRVQPDPAEWLDRYTSALLRRLKIK
jgi:hypothetical protein